MGQPLADTGVKYPNEHGRMLGILIILTRLIEDLQLDMYWNLYWKALERVLCIDLTCTVFDHPNSKGFMNFYIAIHYLKQILMDGESQYSRFLFGRY